MVGFTRRVGRADGWMRADAQGGDWDLKVCLVYKPTSESQPTYQWLEASPRLYGSGLHHILP